MAKLLKEDQEKIVAELYQNGMAIKAIADKFCVSNNCIHNTLHRLGISTKRKCLTKDLDINKVLELYNHGVGVAGVARKLGYGRTAMTNFFKKHNIYIRNASEQQFERMKYSTPEQIAYLTKAAHKAAKGRTKTEEEKKKSAITKFKNSKVKSVYEKIFIKELQQQKIDFYYQYPMNIYNIDFIINGVAVEIFGGSWHLTGQHKEQFPKRTKFILDKGYPILFIFIGKEKNFIKMINDVILPNIAEMSRDKLFIGKYRILWNEGKFVTEGDKTTVDKALECPTINRPNPITGRFESILKENYRVDYC